MIISIRADIRGPPCSHAWKEVPQEAVALLFQCGLLACFSTWTQVQVQKAFHRES